MSLLRSVQVSSSGLMKLNRVYTQPFTILCLLFTILCSLFTNYSNSQNIKGFTELSDQYIKELTGFFESVEKKEDKNKCLKLLQDFKTDWEAGKFSDKQKKQIYLTSNLMLNKKMKAYPHFYTYLSVVLNLSKTQQFNITFEPFHYSLNFILNSPRSKNYIGYLETLNDIFTDNFLYNSPTTKWKSSKTYENFIFDSVPQFMYNSINLTCYANKDSSCILNTSGVYYPLNFKWKAIIRTNSI